VCLNVQLMVYNITTNYHRWTSQDINPREIKYLGKSFANQFAKHCISTCTLTPQASLLQNVRFGCAKHGSHARWHVEIMEFVKSCLFPLVKLSTPSKFLKFLQI